MLSEIRCIGFPSWRSKFLGSITSTLASHICSTDSIPWVRHLREEGSLDYDRGFVRLQVHLEFNTNIYRQQPPFSGAVPGEQVIKIRSFIAFCVISVFFWFYFLHLLTFDHPQNQSNLVCLTLVFLDLFFIFRFCIFCLSLTLTGDGRLPLHKPDNFVDDPEKLYRPRRHE
jgi:hypothetical protein